LRSRPAEVSRAAARSRIRRGGCFALGAFALSFAVGSACLTSGDPLEKITDNEPDDRDPPPDAGTTDPPPDAGVEDPFGLGGIDPPHGSFAGGLRAVVRGSGFGGATRVWIGDAPAEDVVVLSPTRVQVTTPRGTPGLADVVTQVGDDDSTRRTLADAFTFDPFFLDPDEGPTAGGTEVRIVGEGTSWDAGTDVRIDGKACASLSVVGPEELSCVVAPGTNGAKPVRIGNTDEDAVTVLDAFTYESVPDGLRGGLGGDPLDGRIEVLALNNFTGEPLVGGMVVFGQRTEDAIIEYADEDGRVVLEDASLDDAVTVTVTANCHQPITFVDVGVDRVTAYLDPILVPSCGSPQLPPPTGSGGSSSAQVKGQIFWGTVGEFDRGPFDVPAPSPEEKRVAYVFSAQAGQGSGFVMPSPALAITEDAEGGTFGYPFEITVQPGNRVLYAIAGLEDRSGPTVRFVAWSMGVIRGVVATSQVPVEDVAIEMRYPLEHGLTIEVDPPPPGERGPDRLTVTSSIQLGTEGFLLLPQGKVTRPLPFEGGIDFIGLPLLDGPLAGGAYVAQVRAGTGASNGVPASVVTRVATSVASTVDAGPFVGIPTLTDPPDGGGWDRRRLSWDFGEGGSTIDLSVVEIVAQGGLVHWRVVAPGGGRDLEVPDLAVLGAPIGPVFGLLEMVVVGGRIDGFDYDDLRYRDLRTQYMDAFAVDTFGVHYDN